MMKKSIISILVVSATFMSGCDYFKNKKETAEEKTEVMSDWSCTDQGNINQVQDFMKAEYLKKLEKDLRQSSYSADQELLDKITKNLKFEIKGVTTLTENPEQAKQLDCSSQLIVHFPKGLQKRAENAYLEQNICEDCDGEDGNQNSTLRDYLEGGEYALTLGDDQLKGDFSYSITKTDKEGLSLNVPGQSSVIDGVVFVTVKAVQYAAYKKENAEMVEYSEKNSQEYAAQAELAQKAMNIRKKEFDADKVKAVERLNQTWDQFTDEQKQQLQQDQSDWFEKRDVDCKVLAQKSVNQLNESDKETYQKHSGYWDDAMYAQDQEMQYTKCFIQKTKERTVYLNNVYN